MLLWENYKKVQLSHISHLQESSSQVSGLSFAVKKKLDRYTLSVLKFSPMISKLLTCWWFSEEAMKKTQMHVLEGLFSQYCLPRRPGRRRVDRLIGLQKGGKWGSRPERWRALHLHWTISNKFLLLKKEGKNYLYHVPCLANWLLNGIHP